MTSVTTLWQAVTWDVARAGGFTAYILLALAVIVGLALSTQLQSPSRWPRLLNSELHNFLTLLSTIFVVVHVLAVWVDPFTRFGWQDIFIPFLSTYRTFWMALGIVALYLGIAIGISTWLRPRIGYKLWRKLHVLTLGIFVLVTIHGIGTGSDTQTPWALGIYLTSVALVGILLCRRLFAMPKKQKHVPAQAPSRRTGTIPQSNVPVGTVGAATQRNLGQQGARMAVPPPEEEPGRDSSYTLKKHAVPGFYGMGSALRQGVGGSVRVADSRENETQPEPLKT